MRQRRETPEPWASAMEHAGISSLQQLARKTGLPVSTLTRLVHSEGTPSARTVDAVAGALHRNAQTVAEWASVEWRSRPVLPDTARELTPKQWRAVERLIDAMVNPGESEQEVKGGSNTTGDEPHLRAASDRDEPEEPTTNDPKRGD